MEAAEPPLAHRLTNYRRQTRTVRKNACDSLRANARVQYLSGGFGALQKRVIVVASMFLLWLRDVCDSRSRSQGA